MGTNTEQESDMYRQQVDCSALLEQHKEVV